MSDFTSTPTYQLSPDALAFPELKPEERLWRSVIITALEDARITHSDRKHSIAKIKAHNWILNNTSNFFDICCWAGLDPEVIQGNYRKSLKKGIVTFNKKQILWFQYDRVYQRLKENLNIEEKKHIRRQIKIMRTRIYQTSEEILDKTFISFLF